MQAGKLDRRVQFQRAEMVDDGLRSDPAWSDLGGVVWAERIEVSDAERIRNDQLQATIAARFRVRYGSFTSSLTAADRLTCEGRTFEIFGIKEIGRREWLEITAGAQVDQVPG